MSLSLPERRAIPLRAWLAPARAQLVLGPQGAVLRMAGGAQRAATEWPARQAPAAEALTAVLGPLLDALSPRTRLTVQVADAWVRAQMLDLPPGLRGTAEREAFAGIAFRETFGPIAENWRIGLEPALPGRPLLACAVDAVLFDTLKSLLDARRVRLASLRPAWVVLATAHRRRLIGRRGALLTLAHGCASLAWWDGAAWCAQRVQAVGSRPEEGWASLLHTLLPAFPDEGSILYAQRGIPASLPLPKGWRLELIDLEGAA